MGISIGICGVGAFASSFIPLFKAHPLVEHVVLADLDAEKLQAKSEQFGLPDTRPSLDDLCDTDVDAIAVITQNWLHGPQALQCLRAGKHTYSAVPTGLTVQEVEELVRAVEETGLVYMLGETSYYRPAAIYCRQRFAAGDFGRIVYGEGHYYHDWDHGLYDVARWRGGDQWRETGGIPPMYYPTHSTSLIMSVTGAHATHVACFGIPDDHDDGVYDPEVNWWHNPFSNESALLLMSDGSVCRINEFRRIGHPGAVHMSLYGTEGSFEEHVGSRVWATKNHADTTDVTALLAPIGVPVEPEAPPSADADMAKVTDLTTHVGASAVHDVARLPREFIGLPNGHEGAHQFLVDDFVRACAEGQTPPNNVWWAARYMLPGIIAHESAGRGGELMAVPDFGDPPA